MLGGSGLLPLNLPALLKLAITALAIVPLLLLAVRWAASRFFVVDARFESDIGEFEEREKMYDEVDKCFVCDGRGTKKCSRCKSVRYCSQECQSKHWKGGHSRRCREQNDYEDFLCNGNSGRKKSSSIALVPSRGSCKVLGLPKKVLFPYDEFVKLFNWDKHIYPPCGLLNCGNSCFANVILQCLSCTRPLVAYLLEGNHSKTCGRNDSCFLCELQIHVQNVSQSVRPFSPMNILYRLPKIGGNLGNGRQEDAHEFMRFAIDTMQSVCLEEFGGEKVVELSIQETTLIQHIFGGQLQSQVKCTKCDKISNRYENMMDLTVEIHGDAESLEDCLNQFTGKEWLDGENMYKCEGCDEYVKAWKRLTVHRPPNVLTVALKRFQSGRFGKLNKRITFPVTLNLKPYTSVEGDSPDLYDLYAVVVHIDMLNASFFGHYICYTKDFNGNWYRIDDCKVTRVDIEEVLAQAAYMLLYTRRSARPAPQSNIVPANHIDDHRLASEMVRIKVERSETNGFPKEELIESADSINGGYHPKEDGLSVMLDETTDKGINTPVESVNGSSCSVENGGFDPQSSYCLDEEKLLEREDQKTSDDKMQRRDEGTISLSDGINDIHPSIKRPERSRLSHSTPLFPRGFLDRSLMPENGKILRSSMEPLTSNGGLCNGG